MKPNQKEFECIEFASKYYPAPKKLGFFEKLKGKKEDVFRAEECDVSDLKTISRLWSDYGLKDFGMDYTYRGRFDRTDKLDCIKKWVAILYDHQLDTEELEKPLIAKNIEIRKKFYEEEPGGHITTIKTEDLLSESIDRLFGKY